MGFHLQAQSFKPDSRGADAYNANVSVIYLLAGEAGDCELHVALSTATGEPLTVLMTPVTPSITSDGAVPLWQTHAWGVSGAVVTATESVTLTCTCDVALHMVYVGRVA